jgi:hypothetical protein
MGRNAEMSNLMRFDEKDKEGTDLGICTTLVPLQYLLSAIFGAFWVPSWYLLGVFIWPS